MKAKPNAIDKEFDVNILGDSIKMQFMHLDEKYIKKLVRRSVPVNSDAANPLEDTHQETTVLDKNIEMEFKETKRSTLHKEPELVSNPEAREEFKSEGNGQDGNNSDEKFTQKLGSISARMAQDAQKESLKIAEVNKEDEQSH